MSLVTRHDVEAPAHPVLVVALEGWIDAGFAAATAASTILDQVKTEAYATFDADELVDQRSRRPRLRIDDGVRAGVTWSEPQLLVGADRLGAGVALLVGPEPDYRWRAFSAEVTALALEIDARLLVGLGGFPTATPHTRPVRLASTASSESLARSVGFIPGSIDVPAGIGDVVGLGCSTAGIPSVGLWARVPHYVAGMAFPPAALALVEGLAAISGLVLDVEDLRESAEAGRRRVDELIAQSSEHLAMVHRLEVQLDEGDELELPGDADLPSGDEIAAELERYLRGEAQ
ncbi:MAG TPA: PAC2 family protein [Acidimicrobiales bacterium]|nr:PAC2 family protein [Acidimicrobiales bacterium]